MKKTYIDERGWQYAVRPALGNDIFKAFYRKPGQELARGARHGMVHE